MNNCCFTGTISEDPFFEHVGAILRVEFVLELSNYRTSKHTGEKTKISTYIVCEAWHTAAEVFKKLTKRGTKIIVQGSAKNVSKEDDCVIFRINEFDISKEGHLNDRE